MKTLKLQYYAIFLICFGFVSGVSAQSLSDQDASDLVYEYFSNLEPSPLPISVEFAYRPDGSAFKRCKPEREFFASHWVPAHFERIEDGVSRPFDKNKTRSFQKLTQINVYDVVSAECLSSFPNERGNKEATTIFRLQIADHWADIMRDDLTLSNDEQSYSVRPFVKFEMKQAVARPLSEFAVTGVPNIADYTVVLAKYWYEYSIAHLAIIHTRNSKANTNFDRQAIVLVKTDPFTGKAKPIAFKAYGIEEHMDMALPGKWAKKDCCNN